MGPSAIRIAGLPERLRDLGHRVIDDGDLPVKNMEEIGVGDVRARYLPEIVRVTRALAGKTEAIMSSGHFPLVLGGDHAIAVGTATGIISYVRSKRKRMGVLWIDAHGDFNTPETSPSGNIHGMSLAALLGLGPDRLVSLGSRGGGLLPEHVALVGVRSLDEGERKNLKRKGVHVHTMSEIDRYGIHRVMKKALRAVAAETEYVHVSLDLDAVDPVVAPGVGTPVKGGLDYREAHFIMESIAEAGVMTSLEIVEVNPILDENNTSAEFAVELVQSAFGKRTL
jgi:arginase